MRRRAGNDLIQAERRVREGLMGLRLLLHPNHFCCFVFWVFSPLGFLAVSEQQERAFTLGLAGLLGEGVYNFGELVS